MLNMKLNPYLDAYLAFITQYATKQMSEIKNKPILDIENVNHLAISNLFTLSLSSFCNLANIPFSINEYLSTGFLLGQRQPLVNHYSVSFFHFDALDKDYYYDLYNDVLCKTSHARSVSYLAMGIYSFIQFFQQIKKEEAIKNNTPYDDKKTLTVSFIGSSRHIYEASVEFFKKINIQTAHYSLREFLENKDLVLASEHIVLDLNQPLMKEEYNELVSLSNDKLIIDLSLYSDLPAIEEVKLETIFIIYNFIMLVMQDNTRESQVNSYSYEEIK